jgi:alkylation response protein AidB-like acyl-CoA dehydrogenase
MDVLPDEDEAAIQRSADAFLAAECTPSLVRAAEQDPARWSPALYRRIAELGWLRLCLPEQDGGDGVPLTHLAVLFEVLGRHLAPVPVHATMVGAIAIARCGTPGQRALLPAIGAGTLRLSLALQEPDGRWSAEALRLQGRRDGDAVVLNGGKGFVDGFRESGRCLVAFLLEGAPALALVDSKAGGVTAVDLVTTAKDSSAALTFREVRVAMADVIPGAAPLRLVMDLAAALLAAQMAGAARMATERAANYAKDRLAFGQPIGSFQAIQHMAADALITIDGAQLLAREAIWRLGAGLPATVEAAQAKAFANEKCLIACRIAQQIHGGIGFMAEYDQQLWYRRVASWAHRCGTVQEHRKVVAAALLDQQGPVRLDVPLVAE